MQTNSIILLTTTLVLTCPSGLVATTANAQTTEQKQSPSQAHDHTHTCPMHPNIMGFAGDKCPVCGMDLVAIPKDSDAMEGTTTAGETTRIGNIARRLAGIETVAAVKKNVTKTINAVGVVAFDESRLATIAAYVPGRIERLYADYTGVTVRKGDHLVKLYSPELYAAQEEFLQSKRGMNVGSALQTSLLVSSRQKLLELGMIESQIRTLERRGKPESRLVMNAPSGGTVIERLGYQGQYVKAGQPIYKVADLSNVWIEIELYPEDAGLIHYGQKVAARVLSKPDRSFEGRIAFIDPVINPKTRTVKVRIDIPNDDRSMRPGDYAEANIEVDLASTAEYDPQLVGKFICPMHPHVHSEDEGSCPICGMNLAPAKELGFADQPVKSKSFLVIPRTALLSVGRVDAVYVEVERGLFQLRKVTTGPQVGEELLVYQGLSEGEKVAASGAFLIDSQMQLSGKTSLLDLSRNPEAP